MESFFGTLLDSDMVVLWFCDCLWVECVVVGDWWLFEDWR